MNDSQCRVLQFKIQEKLMEAGRVGDEAAGLENRAHSLRLRQRQLLAEVESLREED